MVAPRAARRIHQTRAWPSRRSRPPSTGAA